VFESKALDRNYFLIGKERGAPLNDKGKTEDTFIWGGRFKRNGKKKKK